MSIRSISVEGHAGVVLESAQVRVSVDLDRGAHIFEFVELTSGVNVLYEDPRGVANHVVGGWYELFPNAGPESLHPPVIMHGDVKDLSWSMIDAQPDDDGGLIVAEVESAALPLRLRRSMRLAGSTLTLDYVVSHTSTDAVQFLWGQHITFGEPFLAESTRLSVSTDQLFARPEFDPAVATVAPGGDGSSLTELPRKGGADRVDLSRFPSSPASEMLFADNLDTGWASLASRSVEVDLRWDTGAFPSLWVWFENVGTASDDPNERRVALAIEPQSSAVPSLDRAIRDGSTHTLLPGDELRGTVSATIRPIAGQ